MRCRFAFRKDPCLNVLARIGRSAHVAAHGLARGGMDVVRGRTACRPPYAPRAREPRETTGSTAVGRASGGRWPQDAYNSAIANPDGDGALLGFVHASVEERVS